MCGASAAGAGAASSAAGPTFTSRAAISGAGTGSAADAPAIVVSRKQSTRYLVIVGHARTGAGILCYERAVMIQASIRVLSFWRQVRGVDPAEKRPILLKNIRPCLRPAVRGLPAGAPSRRHLANEAGPQPGRGPRGAMGTSSQPCVWGGSSV